MWIILFSAVDDFGIREQTDLVRAASPGETNGASHEEIETIKKKLYEDTLHSACRIAGLAGVLTSHGYMVRAHPPWLFRWKFYYTPSSRSLLPFPRCPFPSPHCPCPYPYSSSFPTLFFYIRNPRNTGHFHPKSHFEIL